jgi:hypothetical protein
VKYFKPNLGLRNLPATDEHELDAEYQSLLDAMNRLGKKPS